MLIIAERTATQVPITETLTKFGLVSGATLVASIYDRFADAWLQDWITGAWGPTKQVWSLNEGDTGRYGNFANVSQAPSSSDYLDVYIEATAGATAAGEKTILLVNRIRDLADATTAAAILADTAVGGPGPWTTPTGDPVIANPIIDAINAQTALILSACRKDKDGCSSVELLGTIYTGHKGDQLIVPVYRNGSLIPDSELANGTQFSMTIRNITTDTTFNVTEVEFVGTGHVAYTTRAADGIFETAGKWEYQADGLTQQGQPFESLRLTARVYDDV